MTNEADQIPPRERCTVKDCPNRWAQLCRICALQTCKGHITLVKDGGIPGGHFRCPTCAKLPYEEALIVCKSPEARHRQEVFAGRVLLLLRERISPEDWHSMMEEVESLSGGSSQRFQEVTRTAIREMGQYASEHNEET